MLILKGSLSTNINTISWVREKSHGRSFDLEASNLQPVLLSTLWRGRPLTNLLYLHLSCFWKAYFEQWTLLYSTNGDPNGLSDFLTLLPLFCLGVCRLCLFYLSLSLAVVSDWHQELISLLWTWQDVLSLGLISHHACDDNFLFPCSSSARLKLFSQICACISGTLWTLLHARKK